jgi:AraC-like DNA-binding protein
VLEHARARFLAELDGIELIEAAHPRPRFPRHAHATYAVGLVHRGVNRFRYRGAWHLAPAGALCTVTPDEVHDVEPAAGVGFAYRCLYPTHALVAEAAQAVRGRPGAPLLPAVVLDPFTVRLAAALLDGLAAGAPPLESQFRLAALLQALLLRYEPSAAPPRPVPAPTREVARAREILGDRLTENLSLTEVAADAGINRFALARAFRRSYGIPPHAWVIQQRVHAARSLLREGRRPAEVASAVGFSDQSHLTRQFKRLIGVTPGRYSAPLRRS